MSGLAPGAVSLVFVAAFKLGKKVNDRKLKIFLTTVGAFVTLLVNGDKRVDKRNVAWIFPLLLICGGLVTLIESKVATKGDAKDFYSKKKKGWDVDESLDSAISHIGITKCVGALLVLVWAVTLGLITSARHFGWLEGNLIGLLFETFFRIGSIIYGGGQVVLPMLLTEVVEPGWVTKDQFYQVGSCG